MKQPKESNIHLRDSSGRNQESNGYDLVADRIGDLPDSILGIILSFLPTKEAVATSVLSKRWELLWVTIQNFDFSFNGDQIKDGDEVMKFIRFVDRVLLLLLHDAGFLNKFCFYWHHNCIPSHAISWINTAIRKNVHELLISVRTSVLDDFPGPLEMPISFFNCDSLRSLELVDNISVSAAAVCFPRLESLKLDSVFFWPEEAFEKFISGCPMLKYLDMHMSIWDLFRNYDLKGFTYIISSTSLRRLELNLYSDWNEEDTYFRLKLVDTCSLEYLKLEGFIYEIVVKKSLSSLTEADLRIKVPTMEFFEANFCNSFVEAVRAFNFAKVLTLSADVMWALNFATISLSTKFTRLMKLETGTYWCESCDCSSLPDFLQCSDNLEALTIYQVSGCKYYGYSDWTDPAQVPRCLSNSLKKVVVNDINYVSFVREMIRYILKNGSALETMKISCCEDIPNSEKLQLHQEIGNFPNKAKVDIIS